VVAKRQEDEEQSVGLRKLARESLAESDDNWDAALVRMRTRLAEDRRLYDRLIDPLIDDACWAAIRYESREVRRLMPGGDRFIRNPDGGREGLLLLAQENARSLLHFPLRGGKKLGDADKKAVLTEAEHYSKTSRTLGVRGRWLALVAEAMGNAPTVADELGDGELVRLLRQAEEESGGH
jgi:hypothetical protein